MLTLPGRKNRSVRRENRRGTAVVEMALISPVLFLFIFGLLELGRIYWVQRSLRSACQDAVRYGTIRGVEVEDVVARVQERIATSIDPSVCQIIVRDASIYDTSGPYPHQEHVDDGFVSLPEFNAENPLSEQDPGSMIVVRAEVAYEDITYLPLGTMSRLMGLVANAPPESLFEGLTFSCYTFARHE